MTAPFRASQSTPAFRPGRLSLGKKCGVSPAHECSTEAERDNGELGGCPHGHVARVGHRRRTRNAGRGIACAGRFRVALPDADGHVCMEVAHAESGEEGLEQMETGKFDIVLLDQSYRNVRPRCAGTAQSETRRRAGHHDHGYASLDVAVSGHQARAFDFLAKPFTPESCAMRFRQGGPGTIFLRCRHASWRKRNARFAFSFLSVLVHELKAPLVAVEGYLRLLQEGAATDPETAARAVDRSLVRLDGMPSSSVDLLDLTRIESGQKAREFALVDVAEVARAAIETRCRLRGNAPSRSNCTPPRRW